MNAILSEKEYQKYILERLSENGYEIKPAASYDRLFAINLALMYTKPATTFNTVLNKLYEQNIFTVSEEV